MARAHARKKASRNIVSKQTPGQAKRAPRKKFLKLRKKVAYENDSQILQNQFDCHIILQGYKNWTDFFKDRSITFSQPKDNIWIKYCGATKVSYLDYMQVEADLNRVSLERVVLNNLVSDGFILEALEVNFLGQKRSEWGRCTWYKEHKHYSNPPENIRRMMPKADAEIISYVSSMFKTQHAGDQEFTLTSTQMLGAAMTGQKTGFLFHKALIFRKAVFSLPTAKPQVAKAA